MQKHRLIRSSKSGEVISFGGEIQKRGILQDAFWVLMKFDRDIYNMATSIRTSCSVAFIRKRKLGPFKIYKKSQRKETHRRTADWIYLYLHEVRNWFVETRLPWMVWILHVLLEQQLSRGNWNLSVHMISFLRNLFGREKRGEIKNGILFAKDDTSTFKIINTNKGSRIDRWCRQVG